MENINESLFKKLLQDGMITYRVVKDIKNLCGVDIINDCEISLYDCKVIYNYLYDTYSFKSATEYARSVEKLLSGVCTFRFATKPKGIKNFFYTYNDILKIDSCCILTEQEEELRKMFLISCLSGCDYEDIIKFNKSNIINGNFFYETRYGVQVSVPIHKILKKYIDDGISIPTLNCTTRIMRLRNVIKKSGLNETVAIESENGDINIFNKPNITTFATAQTSFATNMYHAGYSVGEIQSYMGFKTRLNVTKHIVGYRKHNQKTFI